ncbi:MAG TPA: RIP metalloprotease RseP [Marinilabiliales bacterium]|jgi:regulator of sigma E protease|nr:MAG: RIP metalloprotease RseP [Bacteroidetes bacterium GWA2_40_14]OFX65385.1 MAG: RIP metalloprotease RseP [Bacteroidetes bacterium GWC2_40_13]OFX73510.1 MAG: RIP metalloprotease RseP [Bacteroidetes bacterium GWD2_40_43]OFX90814.1 MAG: RIP metalloprotease RseP [Bacteroidetes bacterium GWE2_40_63]OFY20554.1 MAG: RIP metalloprotease RseP [Bacteroidetes bacterium GWF2_40_13]OFZ24124.1 MAG: RIP metalloprotease RseP [Bacteroidetes bacterium RIFOXYC2_FULL_40_12]HAN00464.1 RIP metalloprotease Rse
MEITIRIAQLLLSLSILVIIHEMGHFFFAKLFKTRVEKFYLFFDPWFSLFKIKKGETEYGIGWLPLGGYVKIAGMIDESMDREQMKQPPKPDEFRSKTSGQRLLIMIGGVLFNLVLAVLIYASVLKVWGEEYLPVENMKYGIVCDSAALEIGLQNGDKLVSIDNHKLEKYTSVTAYILLNEAQTIQVERQGEIVEVTIPKELVPRLIKGETFINPRFPFYIADFAKESAGREAGLEVGDRLIGLDTVQTPYFDQFKANIKNYKNKNVLITFVRGNDTLSRQVAIPESGLIGAAPEFGKVFELRKIEYGFFEAIPAGIKKSIKVGQDYLKQFKLLFNPETKAYESVGGFISIGKIFPSVWDWESFWNLTGFLSIMLAILNILPIPALDGGHVMFVLYEIITRRKPSEKFLEYAQMVGFFILLALLILANGNDIIKLFK